MNDNDVRKYKKKVNRNGWKANLQRWTFNREPSYVGYCPFFWMTVFCLCASPFTLVGKVFEFGGKFAVDLFTPEPRKKPKKVEKETTPEDGAIVSAFNFLKAHREDELYKMSNQVYLVVKWARDHPDWKDSYYPKAKANVDKAKEQREKEKAKEKEKEFMRAKHQERHKARMALIVKYTSCTVKPLVSLAILIAAFYVYKLVFALVSLIKWKDVLVASGYMSVGLTICAVIFFAALLVGNFATNVLVSVRRKWDSIPEKPQEYKEHKPSKAAELIETIGEGVCEGVQFVCETVKMTYKAECPLIEWSEEEGKIEKNVPKEEEKV